MPFKVLLFDFDSTLYPYENGYEQSAKENVYKFMVEKLGVPEPDVRDVHAKLFAETNQTLKALRDVGNYKFDREEYFRFTRDGCEALLQQDAGVQKMLAALSGLDKYVFTNADETSAERGLEVLGIQQHFKRTFGSRFMDTVCKPDREAFVKVVTAIGVSMQEVVFFDDSLRNIAAAKKLGITTVYVANRSTPREVWDTPEVHAVADYVVPFTTYDEVHAAFPELFAGQGSPE